MATFTSRFNKLFNAVKKQFSRVTAKYSYDFYDDMMNGVVAKSSNPHAVAVKWYQDNYQNNPQKYVKRKLMEPGSLVIFDYDTPLGGDNLDYWDRNPLVLVLQPYVTKEEKIRVRGINLHLLPPNIRKLVLWQAFYMYKTAYSAKLFNDTAALQVNIEWKAIEKQLKQFGAGFAFRSYSPQLQKNVIEFNQEDWAKAVWIPSRKYERTSLNQLEAEWKKYVNKNKSATAGEKHI